MRKHYSSALALLAMLVLATGSEDTNRERGSSPPTQTRKWYEGGTLHNKSALEWQLASTDNKLASCADFTARIWKTGSFKPSIATQISTVDDLRPYAQELVEFLDAAFQPDPDPAENRKIFANQKVSESAAAGMILLGWNE